MADHHPVRSSITASRRAPTSSLRSGRGLHDRHHVDGAVERRLAGGLAERVGELSPASFDSISDTPARDCSKRLRVGPLGVVAEQVAVEAHGDVAVGDLDPVVPQPVAQRGSQRALSSLGPHSSLNAPWTSTIFAMDEKLPPGENAPSSRLPVGTVGGPSARRGRAVDQQISPAASATSAAFTGPRLTIRPICSSVNRSWYPAMRQSCSAGGLFRRNRRSAAAYRLRAHRSPRTSDRAAPRGRARPTARWRTSRTGARQPP